MIIFGYRCSSASDSEEGENDGFSITIYENGVAEYKEYVFSDIIKKTKKIYINPVLIKKIEILLKKYQNKILMFDENLDDNLTYDGEFNKFIFNDKQIVTINIEFHNLDEIKKWDSDYYSDYYNVISQQNDIIVIFNKICSLLKKYGIILTLNCFRLSLKYYLTQIQ